MNDTPINTKQQIEAALKDALRARDELRLSTLRMALSAIKLAEVEKGGPLEEPAVLALVQKEIKLRQEAIEEARRAHRPDLEAAGLAEIGVLEGFLPQQMAAEELEALARRVIAEVGAGSLKEMGQVMKVLLPQLAGRASNDQASQVVRRLLS